MRGLWLLWMLLPLLAMADPIDLQLSNGLTARAQFEAGKLDLPAVMLVHGFLQTNESPTIHHLAEALHDKGYTVLLPNLSLNVTNRRQSLACEALHTHTMANDLEEIDAWVNWLRRKQTAGIVLIGHSFGSIHVIAYLHARANAPIRKFIAISAVEARSEFSNGEQQALLDNLHERIRRHDTAMLTRPLSFCRNYTGTPASLASYLEWTPERILSTVRQLTTPGVFIMGGNDERLGPNWIDRLKSTRQRVIVVKGANHFMDGEHEFDLHDLVISELQ